MHMANQQRSQIVDFQQEDRTLIIHWGDEHKSLFHYIWLRDACFSAESGNPKAGKKKFRIIDVPLDIVPRSVRLSETNSIEIIWEQDGHTSLYEGEWLRDHCYSKEERLSRRPQPILWDSHLDKDKLKVPYDGVLNNESDRLRLFQTIKDYGICIVQNVPPQRGELEKFAGSIGPIIENDFGPIFEIIVKPDEKGVSVANSQKALVPHTDDPYRESPPGIIFFHCLAANTDGGGQSIFVDMFSIAKILREQDPEGFALLTRYEQSFQTQKTGELDITASSPIFSLNSFGEVKAVRVSNLFAAPFDLPEETVEPFYKAYRKFMQLYMDSQYWFSIGLRPGDLAIFDNYRVLHGRTAINVVNQKRHLCQCYLARDYIYSQLALLKERLS